MTKKRVMKKGALMYKYCGDSRKIISEDGCWGILITLYAKLII